MLVYYGTAQKQLSLLTAQRSQVANELAATQAQLKQTVLLHAPHELNKALVEQVAQLEQKEKMQQQVLQTVSLSSTTQEKGYAALMRAFAKQSLDGLWLTNFSIDSNTDQLNIGGRALQADLVPEYISRLSNEPALQGKLFSALNMTQPKNDPLTTQRPVTAIAPATPLATDGLIKNNSIASPVTNTGAPPEVNYIEFTLQSSDEKLSPITGIVKDGSKS